jgi:hypothetical protein
MDVGAATKDHGAAARGVVPDRFKLSAERHVNEVLEHHEHAEHAAQHGNKRAALLIAALAAMLAITEQQASHAEIRANINGIFAADAWSQFQGKSTRETVADDLSQALTVLDSGTDPEAASKRMALAKKLQDDSRRYAHDPRDGKDAIVARAHGFEEVRNHALEQAHSFDNAAASLQLGIVLATASVIASSPLLIRLAMAMGVVGLTLGVLGVTWPELGAF